MDPANSAIVSVSTKRPRHTGGSFSTYFPSTFQPLTNYHAPQRRRYHPYQNFVNMRELWQIERRYLNLVENERGTPLPLSSIDILPVDPVPIPAFEADEPLPFPALPAQQRGFEVEPRNDDRRWFTRIIIAMIELLTI